jgi:hypothetical protein
MPLNKSWHDYNESLIERGRILMDIGFLRSSNRETTIAAVVVIIVAIPNEGLLPVILMSAMAVACAGEVVLDIRRHPHHRLFKL